MAITTAQRPGAGLACEQHAARPGHRSERTYNGPTLFRRPSLEKVAPSGQFERERGACSVPCMSDGLSTLYQDLLNGSYDCVDRIVLNAYFRMGHSPGGFRVWWRALTGSDETSKMPT
jgi:hypothetical protein